MATNSRFSKVDWAILHWLFIEHYYISYTIYHMFVDIWKNQKKNLQKFETVPKRNQYCTSHQRLSTSQHLSTISTSQRLNVSTAFIINVSTTTDSPSRIIVTIYVSSMANVFPEVNLLTTLYKRLSSSHVERCSQRSEVSSTSSYAF